MHKCEHICSLHKVQLIKFKNIINICTECLSKIYIPISTVGHNYLTSYLTLWQPRQYHGARKPSTQRPKQQSYTRVPHPPTRQTNPHLFS